MHGLLLAASLYVSRAETPKPLPVPVPVESIADDFARDMYWIVGSHAADLYATSLAIHRCNGLCGEGNPLGVSSEGRIALKLASTASSGLTVWKLRRSGHPKAAKVVRWVTVALNGAFVLNNTVHIIRKR